MALPASGQISVSDILTELGLDSQNPDTNLQGLEQGDFGAINTNNAASDRPDEADPYAMSEWYSYDHNATAPYSNTHYVSLDGVNDYVGGSWSGLSDLVNNDWSISCWVQNNESSNTNMVLWDFNATTFNSGNNNDRVFLTYSVNLNRLVLRVRTNGTNFDRQWALHSNNPATGTGTNSAVKWTSSNQGNVNSYGFCHLVCTYDASQSTATDAMKIYWNGTELTTQATANNGTRTSFTTANVALGNAVSNTTAAGASNIDMDEWALYTDVLSSSEVTTLYNSGTIVSPHTLHTNNLQEVVQFGASNAVNRYGTAFGGSVVGGSTGTYA